MNKYLPITILLCVFTVANCFTQSKKFFAVTGDQFGSVNWIVFRQFDLNEPSSVKTIYVPAETDEAVYDAATASPLNNVPDAVKITNPQTCGCLNTRMVAAIAYDALNNRLYYSTMLGNQLRYLDLNSDKPKSYAVTTQLLKNFSNQPGEASNITRMCFAANGYGYALTNDNQHLIQFSTQKQSNIKDIGSLIDAKTNGENSVKTQFKSWGGDMIADANGALYLFTIQREIFKINVATKVATYLGSIQNMPEDYSVNAAMAIGGADVIVASSINTATYYRVNLTTLQATVLNAGKAQVYNVSDFANATLAFDNNKNESSISVKTLADKVTVSIYPNPVTNHSFSLQLNNFTLGKYTVELSQLQGKKILQHDVNISGSQTEKINLPDGIAAGAYLVKIINNNGESVYTNKVIVAN